MNYLIGIIRYFLAFSILFILGVSGGLAQGSDVRMGISESNDFSRFTGRVLQRIFDRQGQSLNLTAVSVPDDIYSLTNIQHGALDVALVDSRMFYDAILKSGRFQFMGIDYQSLRILLPLYNVPITLVVNKNSGITDLKGLRNKRLNAGMPLSVEHLCVEKIMTAKNWSKQDFSLLTEISGSHSEDTMAFCHGTVDAMVHIGIHPDSGLQQLLNRCNAGLVPMADKDISRMIDNHPAFFRMEIDADIYPGISQRIITFGTQALLVTSQDLESETALEIINIILNNADALADAHPSLSQLRQTKTQPLKRHSNSLLYSPR